MMRLKMMRRVSAVILACLLFLPLWVQAEETVCLQCHAGLEERLSAPVGQWRGSIHAQNGISCHDCHGGDPTDFEMAMSPERGFIGVPEYIEVPEFCGRCHLGVKEDYLASAHGKALELWGPQCVVCHGNHAVEKATIDLINPDSCSRCHEYERAAQVKQIISATEATLVELEASVADLHRVGFDMQRLREDLFSQRNSFRRLFHTVAPERIKKQTAEFDAGLATTREQIEDYEDSVEKRKIAGGAVVVLLLLGGCVALLIKRTFHDEEG
ncbi:Cytochrome c3 [Malonomonas rubra DSM 5091]|uniref:Cytochrome c3 n=1 Tax=Malonomonas rubra DSM 5091 TaxID=1122189 RepID=A0A1M6LZ00_MALRU|nr:cytochrome c3 family protein [Malonomonas rubra]SHJ76411.1 Cytochrome c3 [Malonomonas rubra DSM 5091]